MTRAQVTNRAHNPVEAAGRIWPPRRTVEADLSDAQLQAVQSARTLSVHIDQPLDRMKVDQLRKLAGDRGLDTSGTKAELVARLSGDVDA